MISGICFLLLGRGNRGDMIKPDNHKSTTRLIHVNLFFGVCMFCVSILTYMFCVTSKQQNTSPNPQRAPFPGRNQGIGNKKHLVRSWARYFSVQQSEIHSQASWPAQRSFLFSTMLPLLEGRRGKIDFGRRITV